MANVIVNSGAAQPIIDTLWVNATTAWATDGVISLNRKANQYDLLAIEYVPCYASIANTSWDTVTGTGCRLEYTKPFDQQRIRLRGGGFAYNGTRDVIITQSSTNTTLTSQAALNYYKSKTANFADHMCVPTRIFGIRGVMQA